MQKAIFDEHKGVYRVNNADGTFETYTPAQYAELVGNKEPTPELTPEPEPTPEPTPEPAKPGVLNKILSKK